MILPPTLQRARLPKRDQKFKMGAAAIRATTFIPSYSLRDRIQRNRVADGLRTLILLV